MFCITLKVVIASVVILLLTSCSVGPQIKTEYVILHPGRPMQVLGNATVKGRAIDGSLSKLYSLLIDSGTLFLLILAIKTKLVITAKRKSFSIKNFETFICNTKLVFFAEAKVFFDLLSEISKLQ